MYLNLYALSDKIIVLKWLNKIPIPLGMYIAYKLKTS
jgi:hypothetical protein